jgi:hypothetical protein
MLRLWPLRRSGPVQYVGSGALACLERQALQKRPLSTSADTAHPPNGCAARAHCITRAKTWQQFTVTFHPLGTPQGWGDDLFHPHRRFDAYRVALRQPLCDSHDPNHLQPSVTRRHRTALHHCNRMPSPTRRDPTGRLHGGLVSRVR